MAIGHILRNARLAKQLTESQVAELTRMKIQIVQDLEKDDFHRIAATIYGKGFIKLYAECVGLDPEPLIKDYLRSVEGDKPSLIASEGDRPAEKKDRSLESESKKSFLPRRNSNTEATVAQPESADHGKPVMPSVPGGGATEDCTGTAADGDDLFTYVRRKKTIVDASVAKGGRRAARREKSGPKLIDKLKIFFRESVDFVSGKFSLLVNRVADINWGDKPIKIAGGAVAVLLAVLVIVMVVRGCGAEPPSSGSVPSGLQSPVKLPEPYFD